ncbi:MAG: pseudouridine synthase [Acidithiobacillus sp.]|nr:pseudouridine synthase [Acidithiobacillus sp.]
MDEKLQKVLARYGLGSRRALETWISDGRVQIDGQIAKLGDRVGPSAQILIDGKPLRIPAWTQGRLRILRYHKPAGEICSRRDPEGRPSVFDRLPRLRASRWISIGRLDLNSEGLLLLTNDGDLANRLMHPSAGLQREYAVRVLGRLSDAQIAQLLAGVELEDGPAKFLSVEDAGGEGANHWYNVTLEEGRNREVRRLFQALDLAVSRLIRVRYGPIEMPHHLKVGYVEELPEEERATLLAAVGWQDTAAKSALPSNGRAAGRQPARRNTAQR